MTPPPPRTPDSLPLSRAWQVDKVCDRFEDAWKANQRPRIEDHLGDTPEPERSELLRELIRLDAHYRSLSEEPSADRETVERAAAHETGRDSEQTGPYHADAEPAAPAPGQAVPSDEKHWPAIPGYEILGEIGKGGMGMVYRARQLSANRVVALKVIRRDKLEDLGPAQRRDWLQRFHTEAQAAARVDHEHVVAVYEVGEIDGQPFYSMRYVEGRSLSEILREGLLANRRAAIYLEQVARAIHGVHLCGILHRDIKPGNILVDRNDHPLVTDFGLAKWVEGSSTREQTRGGLGTPEYMSPEQARDAAHATAASDVYSLGATLYALLTGRPPFQAAEPLETMRQVIDKDPVPPRQLNPAIDRDLETICLTALAKEPGRRYQTAGELAQDLQHFLAGEPIRARAVGRLEKARKWVRRNPVVAGLLATVILVLISGTAVSLYFAINAADQAEQARNNEAEAIEARHAADQNAAKAQAHAKSASEQRGLTLDTLKNVVLAIQQQLGEKEARLEVLDKDRIRQLRTQFLQKAVDGLRLVATKGERSGEANHHAVWAELDMGDIFQLAGNTAEAKRHYRRAREIADALAKADPKNARAQRNLVASYERLGNVSLELGDTKAALDAYKSSLKIAEAMARADPKNGQAQRDLAVSYSKLGIGSLELGESKAGLEAYKSSLKIAEALAKADPKSAEAQRDLAVSYKKLGDVSLELGDSKSALKAYKSSLKIDETLAKADPKSAEAQRDLAASYESLGNVSLELGDKKAALEAYKSFLKIAEALARADAKSAQAQRDLAASYERLGTVSLKLGNNMAALEAYKSCVKIAEALGRADPQSAVAQRDLATSYDRLGDLSRKLGDSKAALEAYKSCLKIAEPLGRADPNNVRAQTNLFVSYYKMGSVAQSADDYAGAGNWYAKALGILQPLEKAGKLKAMQFAGAVGEMKQRIDICARAEQSIADLDFALSQPAALVPQLLTIRAIALARRGRPADAAATAAKLRELGAQDSGSLYNAACCYALCVAGVAIGKKAEDLTGQDKAVQESYAARAIAVLREAIQKGYKDVAHIKKDKNLEPLRTRADFQKLLAELEAKIKAGGK